MELKDTRKLKRFFGNYYPRKYMDCDLGGLYNGLKGTAAFYTYLYHLGWIDVKIAEMIINECRNFKFYRDRLEGYFRSDGEEFHTWTMEWDYEDSEWDDEEQEGDDEGR